MPQQQHRDQYSTFCSKRIQTQLSKYIITVHVTGNNNKNIPVVCFFTCKYSAGGEWPPNNTLIRQMPFAIFFCYPFFGLFVADNISPDEINEYQIKRRILLLECFVRCPLLIEKTWCIINLGSLPNCKRNQSKAGYLIPTLGLKLVIERPSSTVYKHKSRPFHSPYLNTHSVFMDSSIKTSVLIK